MKFSILPQLETERLVLRKIENSDVDALQFLRSDEQVNKYISRKNVNSKSETLYFIEKINNGITTNKWLYWIISLKNNSKMIGTICLWNFSKDRKQAEVGYAVLPKFHKKGFATEVLKCIINYGFNNLNLNKIVACTHRNNEDSKNLLTKNKFVLTAKLDDGFVDNIIFEINNEN